jgi:predicted O-linked N-acetylglucosamine transferase (SPINDLY family)
MKRVAVDDLALAVSLHREGKLFRAEKEYRKYLATRPNDPEAIMLLGALKGEMKQYAAAIALLRKAVEIAPGSAAAHFNLGRALVGVNDSEGALPYLTRSLEIVPDRADSHKCLGSALISMERNEYAVDAYRRALDLDPRCPGASLGLGIALSRLYRYSEAVPALLAAVQLDPGDVEAQYQLGRILMANLQYYDGKKVFTHLAEADPGSGAAVSLLVYAKRQTADWAGLTSLEVAVERLVDAPTSQGQKSVVPYPIALISDDPALMLRCARRAATQPAPKAVEAPILNRPASFEKRRIRIAYVSGDYREHATSYLIAELIERHDHGRFEVFGISFSPAEDSPMRRRMANAFEEFFDVRDYSVKATVALMRQRGIDIAIDLTGFNQHGRMGIFANRAAPLQVNYLGWPATTGARYMDYILADPIVIPDALRQHYAEAVVQLPECYQPNDSQRWVPVDIPSRAACGLPNEGVIFCCFNNIFKIGPRIFDIWMRILNQVPGSFLWLIEDMPQTSENLKREAVARGIAKDRLVFAPNLPLAEHLTRHRQADIFLDTMPYNAHTTASDALWSEVPVVTCAGHTFAARVATSLVSAVGLPELSTANLQEYEKLAIDLAQDRDRLRNLKAMLAAARSSSPLFNARRLVRHVERAYEMMWDRWRQQLPPTSFRVPAAE